MNYIYEAVIQRVIDGDTVVAVVDVGFRMTTTLPVRLAHINAPEMNAKGGAAAKEHLKGLVEGKKVVIATFKPMDKYGRWLGEIMVGGIYVNYQMITDGHAVAYEGIGTV